MKPHLAVTAIVLTLQIDQMVAAVGNVRISRLILMNMSQGCSRALIGKLGD
jgi:hypothetical protein